MLGFLGSATGGLAQGLSSELPNDSMHEPSDAHRVQFRLLPARNLTEANEGQALPRLFWPFQSLLPLSVHSCFKAHLQEELSN